ncbi:MAG: hypothetical protein JW934_23690 [Anaerolineae bacterium]|nr:hypothetical protein [Anaerolineae bacterium]
MHAIAENYGAQSRAWLEVPSLPYQHAFNFCAALTSRELSPVAILANDKVYLRELLKRVTGQIIVYLPEVTTLLGVDQRAALGPEIIWDNVTVIDGDELQMPRPSRKTSFIWVEPQSAHLSQARMLLAALAPVQGRVIALTSNWLRSTLPEWQAGRSAHAVEKPLGVYATARFLQSLGFLVQTTYGFQGPTSLVCGLLARLAALLGRTDMVDRLFVAQRRVLRVKRWQTPWSALSIIVARKEASCG